MDSKLSYAVVGLFVIVLTAASIGLSLWLAFGDLDKDYAGYRVYMTESVSGLYVDAPVKYRGVDVGRVRDIGLTDGAPPRVSLLLDIERRVPIKTDTVATLSAQGLTGIAFVELSGGSAEAARLEARPGEPYPVIASAPSLFKRLDSAVSELIANLNRFAEDARALLNREGWKHMAGILEDVRAVTDALAGRRDDLDRTLSNLAVMSEDGARAAARLPQAVAGIDAGAASLQAMAEEFRGAGERLNGLLERGGADLAAAGDRVLPELGVLLQELRTLTASLNRLSRRVEEDPRLLLYGRQLQVPGPGEE